MKDFQVGQIWVTRRGKLVEIHKNDYPSENYPILGRFVGDRRTVGGMTFTADGVQVRGVVCDNDLVALTPDTVVLEPETVVMEGKVTINGDVVAKEKRYFERVLQSIINAGRNARPKHEGGKGENTIYLTPSMYVALEHAVSHEKARVDAPRPVEENRRVSIVSPFELESQVFRAVLEGMEFSAEDLNVMLQKPNAVDHARALGRETIQRALEINAALKRMVGERSET